MLCFWVKAYLPVLVNAIIYNRAIITNVKIIPNLTEMDLDQKLFFDI